jgi:NADH-quinone oxidoreductase subunit L
MIAHAFFKALLFLGSGSVIHALNGEQDLRKMGGLQKYLPLTFPTFLIGWLTISGVPPFAGFWAKGAVLTSLYVHNKALYVLAILTAVLTAYYMTRLFVLTFRGSARFGDEHPHESPWVMTVPLVILAALSVLGGLLDLPWLHQHTLETFLSSSLTPVLPVVGASAGLQITLAIVDIVAALLGLAAAATLWRDRVDDARLVRPFLADVWHWDGAYDRVIGRPLTAVANFSGTVVEEDVIDGAVRGVVDTVQRSSVGVRKIQTGFVRHYALAMFLGLAVIVVYLVARVG